MLRLVVFAGLLALGLSAQLPVSDALADGPAMSASVSAGAAPARCHGAPDAHVSGTLQIEDGAPPTNESGPGRLFDRAPAADDCALV